MEVKTEYLCSCGEKLFFETMGTIYYCKACGNEYSQEEVIKLKGKKSKKIRGGKQMAKKGKCVKCEREDMTIVAKGLCWKCYDSERKGGGKKEKKTKKLKWMKDKLAERPVKSTKGAPDFLLNFFLVIKMDGNVILEKNIGNTCIELKF
jgi:hypothetical protein